MTGADILREYERRFIHKGGDPDACAGVLWSRDWLSNNPDASEDVYIAALAERGRPVWSIAMLHLCWDRLSEGQRLILMRGVPDWALKCMCGWDVFPDGLTTAEVERLRAALTATKAVKALARLNAV